MTSTDVEQGTRDVLLFARGGMPTGNTGEILFLIDEQALSRRAFAKARVVESI